MQRWRLSFNSSRPSRQLKKLWTDCNIKCEEDIEISKVKGFHVFLDALLNCDDPSTQRSNIDEIVDDLIVIFNTLIYSIKYCQIKQVNIDTSSDDCIIWNDLRLKCLIVAELLCTIKGTNTCLKDLIATSSTSYIGNILKALELSTNIADLLSLVRILKVIIFHEQHLNEMATIEGFRILAEVTLRVPEPSLIFQVLYLQRSYLEYARSISLIKNNQLKCSSNHSQVQLRDCHLVEHQQNEVGSIEINERSTSVCSTSSIAMCSNQKPTSLIHPLYNNNTNTFNQVCTTTELDLCYSTNTIPEDDNVSIAEQSLNLAYNLVSELLKYTPLTSDWFKGKNYGENNEAITEGVDVALVTDEQMLIASMMLPMSLIELETERLKQISNHDIVNHSIESMDHTSLDDNIDYHQNNDFSNPDTTNINTDFQNVLELNSSKDRLLQQNMLLIILLAIDKAVNPLEAIETMLTLQSILIADSNAQLIFTTADGYKKISNMLVRIEDNLVLLMSCSDSSLAAATGDPVTSTSSSTERVGINNNSIHSIYNISTNNSSNDSLGAYYAFPKGDFDSYYSQVLMILLNLIVDDSNLMISKIHPVSHLPFLLAQSSEIRNISAATILLTQLLNSTYSGLNVIAIRICFALIRAHPPNVLILEASGIISALMEKLLAIALAGTLDLSALLKYAVSIEHPPDSQHIDDEPRFIPGYDAAINIQQEYQSTNSYSSGSTTKATSYSTTVLSAIFSDILSILQMVSVVTALRDQSMIAFMTIVLLNLSVHSNCLSYNGSNLDSSTSLDADTRCHNCEMEIACLQCLNDGCVNDHCFMLCDECDKVFHKSAAKKSHIRIPTLLHNNHLDNYIPIKQKKAIDSSLAYILNQNADITSMLAILSCKLEESSLKTLHKYNLLSTSIYASQSRIISLSETIAQVDGRPYDLLYRECMSCILLTNIKGLIDDGKVRLLDMPFEIFPALLRCLRSIINCPLTQTPLDRKHAYKEQDVDYSFALMLSEKLNLSVDNRDHKSFGQINSNRSNEQLHIYAQQQPPELNHNSPRRIHLSLLIQCISRFLVTKSDINASKGGLFSDSHNALHSDVNEVYEYHQDGTNSILDPSIQSKCMDLLMMLGIDAILMHICIDDSGTYVHSTAIDKQYIIWLFRECILTASHIKSQHLHRYFHWLTWLLRGNIKISGVLPINNNQSNIDLSNKNKTPGGFLTSNNEFRINLMNSVASNINHTKRLDNDDKSIHTSNELLFITCTQYPVTAPAVSLSIRLMILQELRLLMASFNDTEPNRSIQTNYKNTLISSYISMEAFLIESNSSRSFDKTGLGNNANYNYFRTKQPQQRSSHTINRKQHHLHNSDMKCLFYNMQTKSKATKHLMVELGYAELLLDLLLGNLCSVKVQYILNNFNNNHTSNASIYQLVDIEREEWWMVFATFCQFIQGCDVAKDRVHDYVGEEKTISFILPLLEYASTQQQQHHNTSQSINYQMLFNTFIVELCVRKTNFAMHSNVFHGFTGKLPHQLVQSKQLIPRPTDGNNISTADSKYEQLFMRTTISTMNNNIESESTSTSSTSFNALSPIYFTHPKVVALITDIFSPKPLTLFSASFKQSFAIQSQSSSSLQSLKNKSLLKYANEGFIRSGIDSSIVNETQYIQNHSLLNKKQQTRNNYSTASVQSYDSENRWEIDSLAGSSTHGDTTGRNSFHSYHSLLTLSQALGSQTATPTPSISGDNILHHSGSRLNLVRGQSIDISQKPMNEKINFTEESNTANLFPATIGDKDRSTPTVFIPLLRRLLENREAVATNVLVLLHHVLLIRGGYSDSLLSDLDVMGQEVNTPYTKDNERESIEQLQDHIKVPSCDLGIERNEGLDCRNVLRKHLSVFVLPAITNQPQQWIRKELIHNPSYSRLEICSPEAGEILLSAALATTTSNQTFLFSVISHLIDGNPVNSFKFIKKSSTCISLIQLIPHLTEHMQQVVGYILSQILRYSLQIPVFQEIIKSVSNNNINKLEEFNLNSVEAYSKDLLFVMGRTAERKSPEIFFHFDLSSPLQGRIELPMLTSIPLFQSSTMNGNNISNLDISICTWLRLGALSDSPNSSLFQLYTEESCDKFPASPNILVNIYFRVIYKLVPSNNTNNIFSGSNKNKTENESQHVSKRIVQLCIGIGKSPVYGKSLFQNGRETYDDLHNPGKEILSEPLVSNNHSPTEESLAIETKILNENARLMHWNIAIDQLIGDSSKSSLGSKYSYSTELNTSTLQSSVSILANTISHYSIPDAIVEFDWSEMGDWHLLCLSLTSNEIICSVDGVSQSVLYWTPVGYQYTSSKNSEEYIKKENITANISNLINTKKDTSMGLFYEGLSKISKEYPLKVVLGGLQYEYAAYEFMKDNYPNIINAAESLDSIISGFTGTIGEIAIVSGVPSIHQLMNCVRVGPSQGLRELKSIRLSELTTNVLLNTLPLSNTSLVDIIPIYAGEPSSDYKKDGASMLYSSSLKDKDDLTRLKNISKQKELKSIKFYDSSQIHRTSTILATLKSMGGLKVLYPLLIADKARLVAALRIIGCILVSSSDSLRDFQTMDTDKVILYCAIKHPDLLTLETLQVLFDIICDAKGFLQQPSSIVESSSTSSTSTEGLYNANTDIIHRTVVLELLLNMVIISSKDCQLARSLIDWLREICDEEVNNCQKVLKYSGLFPLLVMLSVWDIGNFDNSSYKPISTSRNHNITSSTKEINHPHTILHHTIDGKEKDLTKEFKVIDLNKINNYDLNESAAELALLANKYKLQLSCYRYIKLLISGTSGEVAGIHNSSNLQVTKTEFNSIQLSILLSFAVTASNSKNENISTDILGTKSLKERNKEKIKKNNRLKRLIYGTCTGIPILHDIDIAASNYWLLSGSLVVLDAILDLANGALQGHLITMIKSSFQPNVFSSMVLQLMSSECIEIRVRSIYILILSFSTLNGKSDPKQINAFDKMHGFQCMAEQLMNFSDGCTTEILDAICNLLFWQRMNKDGKLDLSSEQQSHLEESNNVPAETVEESIAITSPVINHIKTSGNLSSISSPERNNNKLTDTTNQTNATSGILSMFWGSSTSGTTSRSLFTEDSSKLPLIPPPVVALDIESQSVKTETLPIHSNPQGIDSMKSQTDIPQNSLGTSKKTTISAASTQLEASTNAETIQVASSLSQTDIHESSVNVEVIEIPQALEVLFKVLQNSKSSEQINAIFRRLDKSITMNQALPNIAINKLNKTQTRSGVVDVHSQNALQLNQLILNNMEQIFIQKDWLIWLCELLMIFKRNTLNSFLDDHGSIFSLSENDSISHVAFGQQQQQQHPYYTTTGDADHGMYEDSEDSNSISGDTMSEELNSSIQYSKADSQSGGIGTQQQQIIDQYNSSIYCFICKLIVQDMTSSKLNSSRRWNELFRISLPELNEIQETIMLDIVRNISNLVEYHFDLTITINIFKNFAMLLEQALEKTDLSLLFSVKVIQALHSINYNCIPEIRIRIKETFLPEVRKAYVTKCLLDNNNDYYSKVAALSEINSSIQNFISLREFKLLTDTQSVMIILGLFVETCEDMEFLLAGVDSTQVVFDPTYSQNNYNNANNNANNNNNISQQGACKDRLGGSPITINTGAQDRLQLLLEVMEALIVCIQNCVISSTECYKCVSKLVLNIPSDPLSFVADALLYSFNKSDSATTTTIPQASSQKVNSNHSVESIPINNSNTKILLVSNPSIDDVINSEDFTIDSNSTATIADIESGIKQPTLINTATSGSTYNWWSWSTPPVETAIATTATATTAPSALIPITTIAAGNGSGSGGMDNISLLDSKLDSCISNNSNISNESIRIGDNKVVDLNPNATDNTTSILNEDNLNDAEQIKAIKNPKNIRSFLKWFCSFEQRDVQSNFRIRVLTEIKSTQRHTDKLREKSFQRYMRFTRSIQEKRAKEKFNNSKLVKDALVNSKLLSDKVMIKFEKDLKAWINTIYEKADVGKHIFNHSSVQVNLNGNIINNSKDITNIQTVENNSNNNNTTNKEELLKYLDTHLSNYYSNYPDHNNNHNNSSNNNNHNYNNNGNNSINQQQGITTTQSQISSVSNADNSIKIFNVLQKFFINHHS